jgi:hypothetical protein
VQRFANAGSIGRASNLRAAVPFHCAAQDKAAVCGQASLASIAVLNHGTLISISNRHVVGDVMQIRSKTYLQFISWWRSFRGLMPPHDSDAPAEASPPLIYTTVVLALLRAILEVDSHRGQLQSVGLLTDTYAIQPAFMGP